MHIQWHLLFELLKTKPNLSEAERADELANAGQLSTDTKDDSGSVKKALHSLRDIQMQLGNSAMGRLMEKLDSAHGQSTHRPSILHQSANLSSDNKLPSDNKALSIALRQLFDSLPTPSPAAWENLIHHAAGMSHQRFSQLIHLLVKQIRQLPAAQQQLLLQHLRSLPKQIRDDAVVSALVAQLLIDSSAAEFDAAADTEPDDS